MTITMPKIGSRACLGFVFLLLLSLHGLHGALLFRQLRTPVRVRFPFLHWKNFVPSVSKLPIWY